MEEYFDGGVFQPGDEGEEVRAGDEEVRAGDRRGEDAGGEEVR